MKRSFDSATTGGAVRDLTDDLTEATPGDASAASTILIVDRIEKLIEQLATLTEHVECIGRVMADEESISRVTPDRSAAGRLNH